MNAESEPQQDWQEQLWRQEKMLRSYKTDSQSSDQLRNHLRSLQPEWRDLVGHTEYLTEIPERTYLISDAELVLE